MNYGPFITKAQAKAQGLRYYFDGSTCRKGHTDVRELDGLGTRCVQCRQAKARAKYERDKQDPAKYEKIKAQLAKNKRDRRARRTPEQREAELADRRAAKTQNSANETAWQLKPATTKLPERSQRLVRIAGLTPTAKSTTPGSMPTKKPSAKLTLRSGLPRITVLSLHPISPSGKGASLQS